MRFVSGRALAVLAAIALAGCGSSAPASSSAAAPRLPRLAWQPAGRRHRLARPRARPSVSGPVEHHYQCARLAYAASEAVPGQRRERGPPEHQLHHGHQVAGRRPARWNRSWRPGGHHRPGCRLARSDCGCPPDELRHGVGGPQRRHLRQPVEG